MIQITDTMAIKADKRSYSICFLKKHKDHKTGKEVESFVPEFYFTEPEHLFHKMIKLAVAEGINCGTWDDVVQCVLDTRETIMGIVLPVLTNCETDC